MEEIRPTAKHFPELPPSEHEYSNIIARGCWLNHSEFKCDPPGLTNGFSFSHPLVFCFHSPR